MPCRPTDTHIRYGHSTWAVDEPGALVMADRPVQPGRTWRAGERPDSTVIILTQVSLGRPRRLGEHNTRALASTISFRTTLSGPDARRPATLPHSHVCLCSATPASPRPGQPRGRAGQGQPLSRRSIPCSRDTLLLFRLRPVGADNAWLSASQHPIQWSPPQDCW